MNAPCMVVLKHPIIIVADVITPCAAPVWKVILPIAERRVRENAKKREGSAPYTKSYRGLARYRPIKITF